MVYIRLILKYYLGEYDKTLTENQKEIRKLGWNRILYHHIMLKLADEFQMLWIL